MLVYKKNINITAYEQFLLHLKLNGIFPVAFPTPCRSLRVFFYIPYGVAGGIILQIPSAGVNINRVTMMKKVDQRSPKGRQPATSSIHCAKNPAISGKRDLCLQVILLLPQGSLNNNFAF